MNTSQSRQLLGCFRVHRIQKVRVNLHKQGSSLHDDQAKTNKQLLLERQARFNRCWFRRCSAFVVSGEFLYPLMPPQIFASKSERSRSTKLAQAPASVWDKTYSALELPSLPIPVMAKCNWSSTPIYRSTMHNVNNHSLFAYERYLLFDCFLTVTAPDLSHTNSREWTIGWLFVDHQIKVAMPLKNDSTVNPRW